ncbi:WD40-repeat-containing domain protein [Tribonema minus]|uniref:WD40-repeat-containing domain protein n=1 Tax=Tribonema minus TaxID=303371 RepID=A0A836CFG8_9STRA|nr:WD40-repeat-containing domain protein [Tribonema minus]
MVTSGHVVILPTLDTELRASGTRDGLEEQQVAAVPSVDNKGSPRCSRHQCHAAIAVRKLSSSTNRTSAKQTLKSAVLAAHKGQLLAVVNSSSRFKLWDVTTGTARQQYVDAKHAARAVSAIAWHRPQPPAASQSKKRSSSGAQKASSLGLLALGSDDGAVTVWDLQRGVVRTVLSDPSAAAAVSCLAFSLDGTQLYSGSKDDKKVVEWGLEAGEVLRKLKSAHIFFCAGEDEAAAISLALPAPVQHLVSECKSSETGSAESVTVLAVCEGGVLALVRADVGVQGGEVGRVTACQISGGPEHVNDAARGDSALPTECHASDDTVRECHFVSRSHPHPCIHCHIFNFKFNNDVPPPCEQPGSHE